VHQHDGELSPVHRLRQPGQPGVAVGHGKVGAESHRLTDVAGHEVEHVDGGAQLGGRRVLRGDAPGDRQTRAGRRELAGQPLDPLRRQAGLLRGHGGRIRRERGGEPVRVAPLADQHVRHRQRQRGL
jgi:hypothetical protein